MSLTDGRVRHDQHHVSVGSETVDKSTEARIAHVQALEAAAARRRPHSPTSGRTPGKLSLRLAAAQFELLDDIAYLFEPMDIAVSSGAAKVRTKGASECSENGKIKYAQLPRDCVHIQLTCG